MTFAYIHDISNNGKARVFYVGTTDIQCSTFSFEIVGEGVCVLTLHIPPLHHVGGYVYWHYTYLPNTPCWGGMCIDITNTPNMMCSGLPSQEVCCIDNTHTPFQTQCAHVSVKSGGVFTLNIPPNIMCSSLKVQRWGVLTLHIPPAWCAHVSK